jgi:hypothetical protein
MSVMKTLVTRRYGSRALTHEGHQTFIDKGHHTNTKTPDGYKKIRVYLVFDVKHDGHHKARLVADRHLTNTT